MRTTNNNQPNYHIPKISHKMYKKATQQHTQAQPSHQPQNKKYMVDLYANMSGFYQNMFQQVLVAYGDEPDEAKDMISDISPQGSDKIINSLKSKNILSRKEASHLKTLYSKMVEPQLQTENTRAFIERARRTLKDTTNRLNLQDIENANKGDSPFSQGGSVKAFTDMVHLNRYKMTPELNSFLVCLGNLVNDKFLQDSLIGHNDVEKLDFGDFFRNVGNRDQTLSLQNFRNFFVKENHDKSQNLRKQIEMLKRSNETLTQQLIENERILETGNIGSNQQVEQIMSSLNHIAKKHDLTNNIILSEQVILEIIDGGLGNMKTKMEQSDVINQSLNLQVETLRNEQKSLDTNTVKAMELINMIDNTVNEILSGEKLSQRITENTHQIIVKLNDLSNLLTDLKKEQLQMLNDLSSKNNETNNLKQDIEALNQQVSEFQLELGRKDSQIDELQTERKESLMKSNLEEGDKTKKEEEVPAHILEIEQELLKLEGELQLREKEILVREEAFNNAIDEFNSRQDEMKLREEEMFKNAEILEAKHEELLQKEEELANKEIQLEEEFNTRQDEIEQAINEREGEIEGELQKREKEIEEYSEALERMKVEMEEKEKEIENDKMAIENEFDNLRQLKEELENEKLQLQENQRTLDETLEALLNDPQIKDKVERRLLGDKGEDEGEGEEEAVLTTKIHESRDEENHLNENHKEDQVLFDNEERKSHLNPEDQEELALKQLHELPTELKDFIESKLIEQETQLKELSEENDILQEELSKIREERGSRITPEEEEDIANNIYRLTEENENLKKELEKNQNQSGSGYLNSNRNQEIEELTAKLDEVLEECDARGQVLEQKEAEIEEISKRAQELEIENQQFQEKGILIQSELEEYKSNQMGSFNEQEKEDILNEFESIQQENEELKSHIVDFDKERDMKEEHFKEIVDQYEQQMNEMREENRTLAEALSELKPDLFKEGEENNGNVISNPDFTKLLKEASSELRDIKLKYEELKNSEMENEELIKNLKAENEELKIKIEEEKNKIVDKVEESQAPNLQSDSSEILLAENAQLVEKLKAASEEIQELKEKYSDSVLQLEETLAQSNHNFEAQNLLESKLENSKNINQGLRETLEKTEEEKTSLLDRIQKLEIWCRDKGLGLPPMSNDGENPMNQVELERDDEEQKTVEKITQQSPSKPGDDLSMDKLVELLLYTLQFIEGLREVAISDEVSPTEKVSVFIEMIDSYETMGQQEEGKFDLNEIFQKLVEYKGKKDEEESAKKNMMNERRSFDDPTQELSYGELRDNFEQACQLLEDKDSQIGFLQSELENAIKRLEEYVENGQNPDGEAFTKEELEAAVISLREENEELHAKFDEMNKELETMQREYESAQMIIENKEITIGNLKNNLNLFSDDSDDRSTESVKHKFENEVVRLMNENEELRDKLVEMQRDFEEKESELINEINKLVVELNDNQGGEDDEDENPY